jgi:multidrug resistance protein EbrA
MSPYFILAIAIVSEVFGNSMLNISNGFKRLLPSIGVVAGMGIAFYSLSLSLETIPLGMAYAVWAGLGTALTAVIGVVVYKEKFNLKILSGIILIICGVVVLQLSGSVIH